MEEIKKYKLKKEVLTYDERSTLLSVAYIISCNGGEEYNPSLGRFAFGVATLISYFDFLNDKGEEIDVLSTLNTDQMYELLYTFDYKELNIARTNKQLQEIYGAFKDIIDYQTSKEIMENNKTSKYDNILDKILEFIDTYKAVFDTVDMDKFMNDFSMMSKKLKDVRQEDVVKEIIKTMEYKDFDEFEKEVVNKTHISSNDKKTKKDKKKVN